MPQQPVVASSHTCNLSTITWQHAHACGRWHQSWKRGAKRGPEGRERGVCWVPFQTSLVPNMSSQWTARCSLKLHPGS